MAVPTIALYATAPSSVCSPYSCQINSHDFDLNGRSSSAATASSSSQRSSVGGLSCLFSSSTSVRHTSTVGEDLLSSRPDELSCSFSYSPYSSFGSYMKRDQSPVSVFQAPISSSISVGSSRSLPMRFSREKDVDLNIQSSLRSVNSRLLNGFVSQALSSCVDYDSPSFRTHDNSLDGDTSVLVDELTFNMEDSLTRSNPEPYAKDLLLGAQSRHKIFHEEVVVKAFYEAEKAHRGQVRASGDPYLHHCLETAVLLAMIGANSTLVAAGLLHDTLDDSFMNYDYILTTFGAGVADLVEGVSKLSQLSKLARESNTASKTVEADRLHTMFLAMADARAVLIKLADRLHNMMTLDALPSSKQQRFAKETLEIFAPLANRLGIFSWKEQLENLCFKHLYPEQYQELSSKLVNFLDETKITSAEKKLKKSLKDASIPYHTLYGRHKSLYSIYRKMLKKKLSMDEVHDIQGLRLIVEREEDCYKALEIVRGLWPEVPEKFKDYIKKPKFNGYQSIHTVVMGEEMVPLEVQMRTEAMHLQAEYGFAAHWRYKEGGDSKHSSYLLPMVEWARWVVSWQCETVIKDRTSIKPPPSYCTFPSHSRDCPYSYNPYYSGNDGPIFVILIENNKMSVQELPANSAVIDLVLGRGGSSRWTPYGLPVKEDLRPKVNHEPVSDPSFKLKMGDVVELTPIIPGKSLTEYREEIQRMYDQGLSLGTATMAAPRT